jgi:hypothetical protein
MNPAEFPSDWTGVYGSLTIRQVSPSGRPVMSAFNVLSGGGRSALAPGMGLDVRAERLVAPQVAAGARVARTAGELFEEIGEVWGGCLRVRSNYPLCGFGTFATRDLRSCSPVSP